MEQCEYNGWDAACLPVEVGVRGYIGTRVNTLVNSLGLTAKERKDLTRKLSEKATYYIWLKREDEWCN